MLLWPGCGARPKVRSMTTDDSGRAAVAAGNGDGGKVFSVSGCRWDHCGLGLTAIHFGVFLIWRDMPKGINDVCKHTHNMWTLCLEQVAPPRCAVAAGVVHEGSAAEQT